MKVLFDDQVFSMQRYGGVSRYFSSLHYGLKAKTGIKSELGLLFSDNAYIKNKELTGSMLNRLIKKESRRIKYNKWYAGYLLRQNNFDVFHPTYYNPYFLKTLKKPFVLTVHDMIHELFPQYFFYDSDTSKYKEETIKRADHIIAISDCTKNDIQKIYSLDESRISVIPHGYQMLGDEGLSERFTVNGDYILFIGKRFGYKNFNLFIKAVASIIPKYSIKLICAGGGAFQAEEARLISDLNLTNSVRQITVTDTQLAGLYQSALAFIYPSLYEGFGLPVLEAFYNNCPVIMSNSCAFLEVAGAAAVYFDPMDEQSIAFAIENIICSSDKQNELRQKGAERLKLFSFENCLQKTIEVYQSLT